MVGHLLLGEADEELLLAGDERPSRFTRVTLPVVGLQRLGGPALEQALCRLPGVVRVVTRAEDNRVIVDFDANRSTISDFLEMIRRAGFTPGSQTLRLRVSGIYCSECTARIEAALKAVPGVFDATMNAVTNEVKVEYSPVVGTLGQLTQAIETAGPYLAVRVAQSTESEVDRETQACEQEISSLMCKGWFAAIVTIPIMILSYPWLFPIFQDWFQSGSVHPRVVELIMAAASFAVLLYSGNQFFIGTWEGLKRRTANMHTLIAVGTGIAWLYSTLTLLFPQIFPADAQSHVYYDVVTGVTALVVLSLAIELKARGRTSKTIREFIRLQAQTAIVLRDGQQQRLPAEEVLVGDMVIVRPGDLIPVDGEVIEGEATIDEMMLTGESRLVSKTLGDEVIGGTFNKTGSFKFLATKVGKDTALANIIRLMQDAQTTKVPVQYDIDRLSNYFTPLVLILAIIGFVVWYNFGPRPSLNYALAVSMATLLIVCPRVLSITTPMMVATGLGLGTVYGIFIRSAHALQTLAKVTTIVLDKTGAITVGRSSLTDIIVAGKWDENEVLRLAASAEKLTDHPLALAIVEAAEERELTLGQAENFDLIPGYGVSASVNGNHILIGNARLMQREGVGLDGFEANVLALAADGKTALYIAIDSEVAAVMAVAHPIKEDAKTAVTALTRLGLEVVMLTGDHEFTARAVARQIGISRVIAEVLPQDKAFSVHKLQLEGKRIATVGHGIHNAPALAQADIGIAIGTGTQLAVEASDVTLIRGNLTGIVTAIQLSRITMRNTYHSLLGIFSYNILGLIIALGALYPFVGLLLSPLLAALVMTSCGTAIVVNANRLSHWKPVKE